MLLREVIQSANLLFNRFLMPYWKTVIILVVLNIIIGFMLTLRPLVIAPALDTFIESQAKPAESIADITLNNLGSTLITVFSLDINNKLSIGLFVAILYFVFSIFIAGLNIWVVTLLVRTRTSLLKDMIVALHRHLLTFSLSYFHKKKAGDIVSILNNDVARTSNSLGSVARGVLQSFAQISIAAIILFRTDALFSLLIIAFGSIHIFVTKMLSARVHRASSEVADKYGYLGANLMETLTGIKTIKSFVAEKYDSKRVGEAVELFRKHFTHSRILNQLELPLRMVADALVIGFILVLTFYAVSKGRISLQAAVMFLYLSQQLLTPISELFKQVVGLYDMLGGATRIINILETKSAIQDGGKEAKELNSCIVLKDVSFSYDGNRNILKNLNLVINRGEMVALVGESGSGKTTIVDLILRFFDVSSGVILYDGVDIREFTQPSYRRNFGVVDQECFLFNASVKENIVYNRVENSKALDYAISVANAKDFIELLPEGLDTLVGDRGVRLSGGQRQRIAIARAIYGYPSILVLDEATSAIDSESERAVQKAIDRITKEITTIVIAHRLSTIIHADKVVVLKRGEIEAIGPHSTVLKTSSTYRKLYNRQFASDRLQDVFSNNKNFRVWEI